MAKIEKAKVTVSEIIEKIPEPESIIEGEFADERVLAPDNPITRTLYDNTRYGEPLKGRMQYALVEALHLVERRKMQVKEGKKVLNFDDFVKKARKVEKNFWVRYCAYTDLRNRGYIVKTALKFGADFRVYDRGIKPGEDHAKWIVYPVHEAATLTWYEFAAKNRVAHSTRKRLLMAIIDEEGSCTYYEIAWKRP
jgi:tRNA-intron endonuclease